MITQAIVLYMAYQMGLPTWCKVLLIFSMSYTFLKAVTDAANAEQQ